MTILIHEEKEVLRKVYNSERRMTFSGPAYLHAARLAERGLLLQGRYATFEPIIEKMALVEELIGE
jgi:hypothetical protein